MNHDSTRFGELVRIGTIVLALVLAMAGLAKAGISNNLNADIRVGYSTVDQENNTQENVDQEYNLNWQESIIRNLLAKSTIRYFNYGSSQTTGGNSWRSELQPSGEINWTTNWLAVSAQAMRRDSKSNDLTTRLINESGGILLRTQAVRYPWLRIRLQQDKLYNKINLRDRDTRERLASAGVGYNSTTSSIIYNFAHKQTLNRSQQLEQRSNFHVFQIDHLKTFAEGKIRSNFSYNFNYKNEQDKNLAFDAFPRTIPLLFGLYANDATPDLGSLDTVSTLTDGNTAAAALSQINIGGNEVNQNIGADLGYQREVSLLYVYTDRPSGNNVRWNVFRSEDNSIWEQVTGATTNYSPGFSRYEVAFPEVKARYIKAINQGLNEVDTVYVTEIEALERVTETGVSKRDQLVHIASLNNSYMISPSWNANAGISLRRDGGGAAQQARDETYYTFGARNQITPEMSHGARIQIGLIDYEQSRTDVDKIFSANYDLKYQPLQTLEFSVSLTHRDNYIASVKSQEVNYFALRTRGDLLPQLRVHQELSGGRNTLMQGNSRFDMWSYRTSMDGRVTRRIDAAASYSHQEVRDLTDYLRSKNQYSVTFGYRVTENIHLRGDWGFTKDDKTRYISHNYSFSWLMSRKISAGAAIALSDYENGVDTYSESYSAQVEYSFSNRTVITGSYSENDLTSAGGGSNRSVRVGIRTGL